MRVERIGRYEVRKILGGGTVGTVYLAHDPVIGRDVALKTLRLELGQQDEFRSRFLDEARAAGRLSHPNIVTVFDVGEDQEQGLLYISMECVSGENLNLALGGNAPLAVDETAALASAVADALHYAHDNGIVHRDVKPSNIMISDTGRVKLADFGIARLPNSRLTAAGRVIGTPVYMSPEQVSGQTVDGRSDLYSLGVVLFELLTGDLPFRADSLTELALRITQHAAPDLAELRPDLASTLAPVINRCLAKDPADRFQNGHEMAQAVREAATAWKLTATQPVEDVAADYRTTVIRLEEEDRVLLNELGNTVDLRSGADEHRDQGDSPSLLSSLGWVVPVVTAVAAVVALTLGLVLHKTDDRPVVDPPAADRIVVHPLVFDPPAFDPPAAESQVVDPQILAVETAGRIETPQDLLENAARLLAGGDFEGAIDAASQTLADDPSSQAARDLIGEARGRQQALREPARLSIRFNCPINRGNLELTLDGEELESIAWDFTRKVVLGIKRGGRGDVTGSVQVPPGYHRLSLRVISEKRGVVGEHSFEQTLGPGSQWQLVVDMPKKKSTPSFELQPIESD